MTLDAAHVAVEHALVQQAARRRAGTAGSTRSTAAAPGAYVQVRKLDGSIVGGRLDPAVLRSTKTTAAAEAARDDHAAERRRERRRPRALLHGRRAERRRPVPRACLDRAAGEQLPPDHRRPRSRVSTARCTGCSGSSSLVTVAVLAGDRPARALGRAPRRCGRSRRSSRPRARSPPATSRSGSSAPTTAPRSAGSGSRSTRCSSQIETAFRAREASERKLRRFVADASHELRTPLTAVRAYAELFTRGADERPDDLARSMTGIEPRVGADEPARRRPAPARPARRRPPARAQGGRARATSSATPSRPARAVEPDRPIDAPRRAAVVPATTTGCARSSTTCSRTSARTRPPGRRCERHASSSANGDAP